MATKISRGISRGQIWTSMDGTSWQVMLIEPYRCDITLESTYLAFVENIVTGHISTDSFATINEAKAWCENESIRLSNKRRTKS